MMVVTCTKCGKTIHKAEKCPYCANTIGFENANEVINVHENVADEFSDMTDLLISGKFSQLIEKSRVVLRWMPMCSSVFWMRFLAKNECKTDAELIQKGVRCEDAADFYNAYRYGSAAEKAAYDNVKKLIEAIRVAFETAVNRHEYEEKAATPIVRCQSEFALEIQTRQKELFDLWTQLEKLEQEMYVIEQDCKLLLNEHRIALDSAKNSASSIKDQIYKLSECTAEELHKYLVRLGDVLNQSDSSKKEIELMRKQLPWIGTFNSKIQERDSISSKISAKLSELKSYENMVKSTVSEIERIEKRHQLAMRSLANYDFNNVRSLLGARKFDEIISKVRCAMIAENDNEIASNN